MGMGFALDADAAVLVAVRDATNLDADHERFVDYMARLDRAGVSRGLAPVAILTTERDTPAPSAAWRSRFAESATKSAAPEMLFCLVTASAVQRGVLTALQWLMPKRKLSMRPFATFSEACDAAAAYRGITPALLGRLHALALADQRSRR